MGWRTRIVLASGETLRYLHGRVVCARPHLLVVGATDASGVRRLLLSSPGEGAPESEQVAALFAR